MTTDSNVRSIQGEATQGELVPNRRAKFVGMSVNELEEPLPFGASVKLTVEAVVTGDGRERRKDGVIVHTATLRVSEVTIDKVAEPEDTNEPLPFDDAAEG